MAIKIHIKSNFVVPGLKEKESITLDHSFLTLRQFLEELARISPTRITYVKPNARVLDPDDWAVDINGIPYQEYPEKLEASLKDGDTVAVKILAFGGG